MIFFDTVEAAQQAADTLSRLNGQSRKLLSVCIETQGVKRKNASAAACALENAGFVIIRDGNKVFPEVFIEIIPTWAGEEAMEFLEQREAAH